MHDTTINRVARNADGTELSEPVSITDITYAQAMTYDYGLYQGQKWAGLKLLTLEEALILAKKLGLSIMVESKYNDAEKVTSIVELIKRYNMLESCIFQSLAFAALQTILGLYPQAKVLWLSEITQNNINSFDEIIKTESNNLFIGVDYTTVNSMSDIELATNKGINVVLYTVNNDNYILNTMPLGVWGVISDRYVVSKLLNDDMMSHIIT